MARKKRVYEQLCDCSAYPFRHRIFGGMCRGLQICVDTFPSRECKNCMLGRCGYCEVVEGQESTMECPVVQDFINHHEIRVYNPKLVKLDKRKR